MGESAGLLRLTVKQEGAQDELEGIEYECDSLDHQGWASLIQTCIEEKLSSLTFLISKRILQEASVYFRCLLSGDFRESAERNVCVTWDPSVFCYLLQFICTRKLDGGCDLESFLNAIMFFGVEVGTVTVMEKMNEIGLVELAPNLWTTANGFGDHLVAEVCIKTFAINFEDAMRRIESGNLPADFVAACLQHEQLTVSSERSLCDALLNWFRTMQKDQVYIVDGVLNKTVHSILRKEIKERIGNDLMCNRF